jgi:hypothetical protein
MSKEVLCYADGCDGRVYKNGYCVEHYVEFGDAPHPAKAGAPESTNNHSSSAADSKSDSKNSSSASSANATNTINVKNLGGGGIPCVICEKTCYPAEITKFEDKIYHRDCFKCSSCVKKLAMNETAVFENKLYCKKCWEKNGFARKQTKVQWTKKEAKPAANRLGLGGGGVPCQVCAKTVYPGEAVQYDAKIYHGKCFRCSACEKQCVPSEVNKFEGKLYCKRDWELGKFSQKQAQTVQNFVPKHSDK